MLLYICYIFILTSSGVCKNSLFSMTILGASQLKPYVNVQTSVIGTCCLQIEH